MYAVCYSDTWNEWTISEVIDDLLDFQVWTYGGRPATIDDVEVVTTHYYGDEWAESGGIDYRYLKREGAGIWKISIQEAFDIGYKAITEYIEEQNSEWEDVGYAEGHEW
jgi:hypothetical protein